MSVPAETSAPQGTAQGTVDATYGYSLDELLEVGAPPGPSDFEEFWRARYEESRGVDPDPKLCWTEVRDDREISELTFAAAGGVRLTGWLSRPLGGRESRGVVIGHGYHPRLGPDVEPTRPSAALFMPAFRGLGASCMPEVAEEVGAHVTAGIESRETYLVGWCAADVWASASAIEELIPETVGHLGYRGTSFGGGVGALALPWDRRFVAADLLLPTFGNHPLRLTLGQSVGSLAAVADYVRDHPEAYSVLSYFDAATAAQHIRVPVRVVAAASDPAVPPPGQFAIYNALGGPKELTVIRAGHTRNVGSEADWARATEQGERFLERHSVNPDHAS